MSLNSDLGRDKQKHASGLIFSVHIQPVSHLRTTEVIATVINYREIIKK